MHAEGQPPLIHSDILNTPITALITQWMYWMVNNILFNWTGLLRTGKYLVYGAGRINLVGRIRVEPTRGLNIPQTTPDIIYKLSTPRYTRQPTTAPGYPRVLSLSKVMAETITSKSIVHIDWTRQKFETLECFSISSHKLIFHMSTCIYERHYVNKLPVKLPDKYNIERNVENQIRNTYKKHIFQFRN